MDDATASAPRTSAPAPGSDAPPVDPTSATARGSLANPRRTTL